MNIKRNAVQCNHCGAIVESKHRHDYRCCECPPGKRICVDGGLDYVKGSFGLAASWTDLSEVDDS